MQRHNQTEHEILAKLSRLETSWEDAHALKIIGYLRELAPNPKMIRKEIERVLDLDFECGVDIVRMFLDLSADEFRAARESELGKGRTGVTFYRQDKQAFLAALENLGLISAIKNTAERTLHWSDTLVERLKAGRGSAIKGQTRGRQLEIATESVVKTVFGNGGYDQRCRFVGKRGVETETEKADFAIPSRLQPRILIEVKGYGATGSKQTDIIGDIRRIVEEKRSDTTLLLILDGITWKARVNDLRKLVTMQNRGDIIRIYTTLMFEELHADLTELRKEHHLS